MKTSEVAELLGVSPMTVRNWADKGILKCEWVGFQRRFNRDDIQANMKSCMLDKRIARQERIAEDAQYQLEQLYMQRALSKEFSPELARNDVIITSS